MIRINLIPVEERIVTTTSGPNWSVIALTVAPVVFGLILFTVFMYQNHQLTMLTEQINQEEATLAKYKPAVAKLKQLREEQTEIQARLDALHEIDEYRALPVQMMEAVNRSVPRYLWLETVEETGGGGVELKITGSTFSNLIVSDFLDRLEDSHMFVVPELNIAEEKKIGQTKVVNFTLIARGDPDADDVSGDVSTAALAEIGEIHEF